MNLLKMPGQIALETNS